MEASMGRRPGIAAGKSSVAVAVAVACGLLGQYIKENGRIADLGLSAASQPPGVPEGYCQFEDKSETSQTPATMLLFPGADVSGGMREGKGPNEEELLQNLMTTDARETKRSQLTIIYGGKMLVFDCFPADKAKDLMQLASKGTPTLKNSNQVTPSSKFAAVDSELAKTPELTNASDLPIARKSSLQRFLEKRKDRIGAKAPYQVVLSPASSPAVKPEEAKK